MNCILISPTRWLLEGGSFALFNFSDGVRILLKSAFCLGTSSGWVAKFFQFLIIMFQRRLLLDGLGDLIPYCANQGP